MIPFYDNKKEKPNTSKSIETDRRSSRIRIENEIENEQDRSNNNVISKSDKIDMIKKIFLSNSSFNKHTKEYFMTRFQIILILKQSNILNQRIITKTQADILLTKLKPNHNKYTFVDFINYLTEICIYIFKEKFDNCPKRFMSNFLDYLLNNYYDSFQEKLELNYVETKIENNCTI